MTAAQAAAFPTPYARLRHKPEEQNVFSRAPKILPGRHTWVRAPFWPETTAEEDDANVNRRSRHFARGSPSDPIAVEPGAHAALEFCRLEAARHSSWFRLATRRPASGGILPNVGRSTPLEEVRHS